jgi:antimicrobial peptide system SdpB family protein
MIKYLEQNNLYTSRLAFARALLAISALLFLVFNDITKMYGYYDSVSASKAFFSAINIFYLFTPSYGKLFAILILLFVCTGYLPQLSAVLQTWVHLSICNCIIFIEGGDQIASNLSLMLMVLCFLDSRKNQWIDTEPHHNRKYINIFSNVFYFLIKLQVAVIYLQAAIGKLNKEEWLSGTALYFWTSNNVFGAPKTLQTFYDFFLLSSFAPLFTWGVIFLELAMFACILATDKRIRFFFLTIGLSFHLLIIITHGLITFFFAMAAALVLYLDKENDLFKRLVRLGKQCYPKNKKVTGKFINV